MTETLIDFEVPIKKKTLTYATTFPEFFQKQK